MKKIDHIGIAVKNLEETLKIYQQSLGLKVGEVEVVAEQKVKVASLPIGESRIELLESTDPEGAVAKFIENRGEGVHHIALRVENIELALQKLKDSGIQLINEKPKLGAHGLKIAFIHPKSTKGVLIELCEGK